MTIYALENDEYVSVETSKSLPMLSAETLTHFLNLRKTESELNVLIAFEDWLKTL